MTSEDIEFLNKLQHEMMVQHTCSTRSPRYWGIMDTKRVYGMDDEYAEGWEVVDEEYEPVGKENDISSVFTYCLKYLDASDESDLRTIQRLQQEVDNDNIECLTDIINDDVFPAKLVYYRVFPVLVPNAIFLTKKACEEYIEKNRDQFENPRSYCMRADPRGEYARIIDIIEHTNWNTVHTQIIQKGPNNTVIGHVEKLTL